MPGDAAPGRAGMTPRLLLFGSGDFAFNLFWQSVSLYLLFFYVDVLALPPAMAGLVFMIGALWDGLADLLAGIVAERTRMPYRRLLALGAVPLGLAFVAMFSVSGAAGALATQLLFRTFYAFANIPYAAWTTRLTAHSDTRALLAGVRMAFGAVAAALVALAFPAARASTAGFATVATLLALTGVPLLLLVALLVPEPVRAGRVRTRIAIPAALAALARNRAFVTLNLAAGLGGAAAALLGQSLLYHFRYVLGDTAGGSRMLAIMGLSGLVFVPLWTIIARRAGARATWLLGGGLALSGLLLFSASGTLSPWGNGLFFVAMQAAFAGFGLAAWGLLPDTVDWGEAQDGVRVEALAFGVFALLQKTALAAAGFAIGAVFDAAGFVAGTVQSATALAAIRWVMLGGPAVLILLAMAAIACNPLRRGTLAALMPARTPPTLPPPAPTD